MKMRLEYFDQNEDFRGLLPVIGHSEEMPPAGDSALKWFLLRLEHPIAYEGAEYQRLLIASRWEGYAVGGKEPTSVFVRIVPAEAKIESGFASESFPHVVWGMAYAIDA